MLSLPVLRARQRREPFFDELPGVGSGHYLSIRGATVKMDLVRVTVSVGFLASVTAACFSSSSSPGPDADAGGSGSSSGSGSSGGSGSSSGGSSSGSGSGGPVDGGKSEAGGGCTTVPLTPTATGYVDTTSLNIVGAWFAYGDNIGTSGAPPGPCTSTGMHPASACSTITSPPPASDGGTASFPQQTPGTMCLSGTAAEVIGTPPDYSNIFGIGIGLDLNNPSGTPATFNASANHVTGFQFNVSGLPTGTVRVELQEPATDKTGDAWSYTLTAAGPVTVQLASGTGAGQLSPAFTPPTGTTQPPFDPTTLEAIQFHVVTSTTGAVPVSSFCVSDLAAIVCP
jgi:hypothetical protein